MIIRKASLKDFPLLVELTGMEGWNYRREDFVKLYETGCSDTLVAADEKGIIGMITVLDYGDVGWISNVLVGKERRGEGLGRRLVNEGLGLLGKKRTVALFAYQDSAGFYLKQGFKKESDYHFVRFIGHDGGEASSSENFDLLALDKECFGYSRPGVLRMLKGSGKLLSPVSGRGFAMLRPDPIEPAIGPVVADDREAGQKLLYASFSRLGKGCMAVVPEVVDGVEETASISRLYLGNKPVLDRARVFALTGLEYG